MHPEHLLLDIPCNFCVFIDFVDGNKGEDVFCGQYLFLQGVIETYPSIHQGCTPYQTDRQHSSEQQAIILQNQSLDTRYKHLLDLPAIILH